MLCELTDEGLDNFAVAYSKPGTFKQTWIVFTVWYQYLPPLVATGIGYAIMHPEINLNGLDLSDDPKRCAVYSGNDYCHDWWDHVHGDAFNKAFWPPMLGYLAGGFLFLNSMLILGCTTKRELQKGHLTGQDACQRGMRNSYLLLGKLSCPPAGTVANAIATVFWSSATQSIYALWGSWMLGLVPDQDAALDLVKTHAVGAAVIPSLLCTAHLVGNVFVYGELNICPPANYYKCGMSDTLKTTVRYTCVPVVAIACMPYFAGKKLADCCRPNEKPSGAVVEPLLAQPVDLEALVAERQWQQQTENAGNSRNNVNILAWMFGRTDEEETCEQTDMPRMGIY